MASILLFQTLLGNPMGLMVVLFSIVLIYLAFWPIYNLFFHPLAKYPGPLFYRMSRLPWCFSLIRGDIPFVLLSFHEKYGDIVRIAPDELAFSHPDAWKDIAGHKVGGGPVAQENPKNPKSYAVLPDDPYNIVNAPKDDHRQLRRQLAHGFSEKGMREQESLISKYVDMFVKRLLQHSEGGKAVDLVAFYNWATFDIIGDLAFGESFGCLENSTYHPWIKTIFDSAEAATILMSLNQFPMLKDLMLKCIPESTKKAGEESRLAAQKKLERRMEKGERPDIIDGLIKEKSRWSMGELISNSNSIVIAGSETTATLLSGTTYLLLANPSALSKVTAEVRNAFTTESEIDLVSVGKLKYMLACLEEAMRMYPPAPGSLPRITPKGGNTVLGEFIPSNTVISVWHWATYHRAKYWTKPFQFHPERWLEDPEFAKDCREVYQPFSVGPRNCIGRNLAYAESRLLLAKVVFHFDMGLAEESRGWMERQKIYFAWKKGPLNVHLTARGKA